MNKKNISAVLEVAGVSKTFYVGKKRAAAVRNVSLSIAENERVALLGGSGCGKSTLARLVTRLDTPDAGVIKLCGADITRAAGSRLRNAYQTVKMIFQDPRSAFDPRWTIGSSIKESLRIRTKTEPKSWYESETQRLLEAVGLDVMFAAAYPNEVSGGECQRAAIARAVASRPKLLICDEATSALDVSVQAQIISLLCSAGESSGIAFLFISHDIALASAFCSRVYVMRSGEIVEHGATDSIITAPKHAYTRLLIDSARQGSRGARNPKAQCAKSA
jgi:peptide/nickel transport system ATP-binding protein